MHCPYCFQFIEEQSQQCPHCGSRLPEDLLEARQKAAPAPTDSSQTTEEPATPLSNRQLFALLAGIVLVLACLCGGLLALARPELLPQPVIAAAPFLASPTPLPTRQATRAPLITPTAVTTETVCSRRAEFCLTFPQGWLVVDQGLPGWQREADALARSHPWLPDLFDVDEVPRVARLRAAPPTLISPVDDRMARVTVGETETITPTLTLGEIETLIQADPATIVETIGRPLPPAANVRRLEREQIAEFPALVIELEASARVQGESMPVRARIYLLQANERLYALSYLADATTIATRRSEFEEILQTFVVEER